MFSFAAGQNLLRLHEGNHVETKAALVLINEFKFNSIWPHPNEQHADDITERAQQCQFSSLRDFLCNTDKVRDRAEVIRPL